MNKRHDRRAVLRGFRDILVALPVLEGCTKLEGLATAPPRQIEAPAQPLTVANPAKRFIALMCPNGVEPAFWFPSGTETEFTLNTQNAALEPIKQHLVLTKGIDNKVAIDAQARGQGNGHAEGVQSLLTGWAPRDRGGNNWVSRGGPSIDQMLSTFHAERGYVGRVRGIHLGEEAPGSYSALSILPNGDREDYTWNTKAFFESPGTQTAQAQDNARLRRKSILDGTRADFMALATRVSGEDKRRVEAHLEALRSIEQRYAMATSCAAPNLPTAMDDDQRRDLMYDIIVAAMACDATRVATVLFRHAGGGGPKLPFLGVFEDIHELSHQVVFEKPDHKCHADFTKYHQWWSRKTVSFVEKLKAAKVPGGGSLFDDTIVFQGSEISWDHAGPDMPFLLIAGEKTPLRTGRYVKFLPKVMHTHLLTTLLNSFGHPATQVGDPVYPPGNLNASLFKA